MKIFAATFFSIFIALNALAEVGKDTSPRPHLRPIMNKIKSTLDQLVFISVTTSFDDKAKHPEIKQSFETLMNLGQDLKTHVATDKTALRFYSLSLTFAVHQAYKNFQKGKFKEAQFFTVKITQACAGCHSALPSAAKKRPTISFGGEKILKPAPSLNRARNLVIARRFDDALKSYEELLLSSKYQHSGIVFLNPFIEYLSVAIRVRNNLVRPLKTLRRILEKPKLPTAVRHDIKRWSQALQQLIKPPNLKNPLLVEARTAIEDGKKLMDYPYDRSGLVHYLHASGLIQQFLDSAPADNLQIAEAYFLLGTTELLTGQSYWLSLSDPYFVAAIKSAPNSKYARLAYAALEHNILLGQSLQDISELGEEERKRLSTLRAIAFQEKK